MGRGNMQIRLDGVNYPTFYIESTAEDQFDPTDWDDIKDNLQNIPSVFSKEDYYGWYSNDYKIIASGKEAAIAIEDNEHNIALAILPLVYLGDGWADDDVKEKLLKYVEEANQMMREIAAIYPLRCYGGPWLTGIKVENPEQYIFYPAIPT